jgi:UDP-3-O-[3-hydroxymyristoyl] glucosamine N-acyltransferase
MPDRRFFAAAGPFTVADLAQIAGAELGGDADPGRLIRDVAPLDAAGPEEVSFLDNPRYVAAFGASRAGACVVHPDRRAAAPPGMSLLLSREPYRAWALIAQRFYPEPAPAGGVAATASVDDTARIGDGAEIGPGAVIGARAEIGRRCIIGANAVIGAGTVTGEDCRIGPCASVTHAVLGRRVRIFAGARIGEAGFGFASGPGGHLSVPQLGRVVIEDDVEIGANTTIDRGAGPDTVIGAGTRIDNLVQIGHNVRIGRGCIIVAQVGISGSTRLEDHVVVAGQGGVTGHLTIGRGAQIAAQAGVMQDVPPGAKVGGSPAVPIRQWLKQTLILARLAKERAGKDG